MSTLYRNQSTDTLMCILIMPALGDNDSILQGQKSSVNISAGHARAAASVLTTPTEIWIPRAPTNCLQSCLRLHKRGKKLHAEPYTAHDRE